MSINRGSVVYPCNARNTTLDVNKLGLYGNRETLNNTVECVKWQRFKWVFNSAFFYLKNLNHKKVP